MALQPVKFTFGSFDYFCSQSPLAICPLVGNQVEPVCYARNVEIAGTLIFEPVLLTPIATLVIYIVALFMTAIMIFNVKTKYTAVGRKEMVIFFYLYMVVVLLDMLLVTGIIPAASVVYPYFVAAQSGFVAATFWCLLLNGFVGFQWAEDGTPLSLWSIRISSFVIFALTMFIGVATFLPLLGMSPKNPMGLYILLTVFTGACLLIYFVLQLVLVIRTLEDRWPLGDILFAFLFFALGIVFEFVVAVSICQSANHYVDGLFFGTIFFLLGVMMVYKYWDSITKEDLEFSVGGKSNTWEIRDPMLSDEQMMLLASQHQKLKKEMSPITPQTVTTATAAQAPIL